MNGARYRFLVFRRGGKPTTAAEAVLAKPLAGQPLPLLLELAKVVQRAYPGAGVRVQDVRGKDNPTLVHHGAAKRALWHVTGTDGRALADLYFGEVVTARAMGQVIATLTGRQVRVYENTRTGSPPLSRHVSFTAGRRMPNPGPEPAVGQVWPRRGGGRVRVLAVTATYVDVLNLETGNRERIERLDFAATHRAPARSNPRRRMAYQGSAVNIFGRKEWDRLTLNEVTAVLKDIAEIADNGEAGSPGDDGWAAFELRRRIGGPASLKSYAASLVSGNRHLNPTFRVSGTLRVRGAGKRSRGVTRARKRGAHSAPAPANVVPMPKAPRAPRARAAREFKPGDRVTVPYSGRASYFGRAVKRTSETGTVLTMVPAESGGEPGVMVSVRRGKGVEQHTFPLHAVRRKPSRIRQPLHVREANKIARLERKYAGRDEALSEAIEKAEAKRERLYDQVGQLMPTARQMEHRDLDRARAAYGRALREIDVLHHVANKLAGPEPWAVGNPSRGKGAKSDRRHRRQAYGNRKLARIARARDFSVRAGTFTRQPAKLIHGMQRRAARVAARAGRTTNRRRPNPRPFGERDRAERMFETWHEFGSKGVKRVRVPSRTLPKYGVKLGEIVTLDYVSDKWEGKPVTYTHDTKRPRPWLVSDPDGQQLFIVGGRMKPTADGLVN